jgi:hypothetical protein
MFGMFINNNISVYIIIYDVQQITIVSRTPNPKKELEEKERKKEKKKNKMIRKGGQRYPWRKRPNKKVENQTPKGHALGWTERTAQH